MRREAGAVSAVAGAVVFEVVCRALFPISSYFPSYGEHTLERGRRSERGLITDADMNNRPGRIRTARLRPTRPNPRDRDIPARVRGGDGVRVDESGMASIPATVSQRSSKSNEATKRKRPVGGWPAAVEYARDGCGG